MSLACNSARDKDFPATSVSFCPEGDAPFFFSPTCLGKKAVLQGDIILAISSWKLYVTLTYPDMFLWRKLSGSTSTLAAQLNATPVLGRFYVLCKGDKYYTDERLCPLLQWQYVQEQMPAFATLIGQISVRIYLCLIGGVSLQFSLAHTSVWSI